MIKSPLTSPLRPALTSPYELITRSVFELNGTQWCELSEPVVLGGDFEIEFYVLIDDTSDFHQLLSGANNSTINVRASDDIIVYLNGDVNRSFTPTVTRGTINKIIVGRSGPLYRVDINGDSDTSTQTITDVHIDRVGQQTTFGTPSPLEGIPFSLKIWTNGDRNTGDLILDIPFDESGTDYQRNHAFVGSIVDANRNWYYQGDLIGDSDLIEIDFPSGDSGPAATASGAVFNPEKSYVVVYEVLSLSVGGSVRLNHGSNGVQDEPYNDTTGIKTAYVIANGSGNGTMQFYALADTQSQIRIISIREWSGVILQSALPEDWMQIERKRWRDYWLSENVILTNIQEWSKAFNGTSSIIDEVDGSVTILSPDNDYAAVYTMELTTGHKYLISGTYNAIEGYAAINIGPETETQLTEVGFNNYIFEGIAAGNSLTLKRYGGGGEDTVNFTTPDARRKLEIAE